MNHISGYTFINKSNPPPRGERGLTLLEVLLSTVVLGIALTGFLMALSSANYTNKITSEENKLVYLANLEFESLRGMEYGKVPFSQTSTPGHIQDVPDYFNDIAISESIPGAGGTTRIFASGDLSTAFTRDYAFDGKRANTNSRWMGNENALAWVDTGGPGGGEGGGGEPGGPGGGEPGGEPGGGDGFAPTDYQYIACAFPKLTKISRILYDNRFNVSESPGAQTTDFDYLPHEKNVWQRNYEFFWTDENIFNSPAYDPWNDVPNPLKIVKGQGYGSPGIQIIYDKPEEPLSASVIGVHNIDTYGDFESDFHWPYASEIEIYGYNNAANYLSYYVSPLGEAQYDNVIMYFPNYLDSGYDLGRRTYITALSQDEADKGHKDLMHVVLEFYPVGSGNGTNLWQQSGWWREDNDEQAKFETSFYRNFSTRVDQLPNLHDFPSHLVYGDNEDLTFPFSVPGASEVRAHFGVFDLEDPSLGNDTLAIEDPDGNIYNGPLGGTAWDNTWTPWVPGDTIVFHFNSDSAGDSYDPGYGGFKVDQVEIRMVGLFD